MTISHAVGVGNQLSVETLNFKTPIVHTSTSVTHCVVINVQNVAVINNATLTLTTLDVENINGLIVRSGSQLVIDAASVNIESGGLDVEPGAELDIR